MSFLTFRQVLHLGLQTLNSALVWGWMLNWALFRLTP